MPGEGEVGGLDEPGVVGVWIGGGADVGGEVRPVVVNPSREGFGGLSPERAAVPVVAELPPGEVPDGTAAEPEELAAGPALDPPGVDPAAGLGLAME